MAELVPYPFGRLISRMFRELEANRSIFDLPEKKFVRGIPGRDLSVRMHGRTAATPLGPAAGPQSQLAQNIVLAWLGGGRIFELKTVQIIDTLQIPRPCIDMQTVGYNVEWSQELLLEQSLEEYVKASMLLEILDASGVIPMPPGFGAYLFDMSVGYDLAGIQSPRVRAFLDGMLDATEVVERLRGQIPEEWKRFRDLEFRTKISDTLTLSTFHGCPPEEIEKMIDFLLKEFGLHCIVKLNPTLLGRDEARRIFNGVLGYHEQIPDAAFEKDTKWDQACAFVERLGATAEGLGLRFGVKFSNTLIVKNEKDFFPKTEKEMYLAGPPLHVLAMQLVARFRGTFGDKYPISFSAGIERANFPDAVSLGLVPVTVCSDLLRPGGYGRMQFYFLDLAKRMAACGARDLEELIVLDGGAADVTLRDAAKVQFGGDGFESRVRSCILALEQRAIGEGRVMDTELLRMAKARPPEDCCVEPGNAPDDIRTIAGAMWDSWVSHAKLANTKRYAAALLEDESYRHAANAKHPPKVGTKLTLFDCITCDKCVPVCPNDANFTYTLPKTEIPVVRLKALPGGGWERTAAAPLVFAKKHQLANFADFCNECGNCDVFCPEDGGPYVMKPRFFGSRTEWMKWKERDGFWLERVGDRDEVLGRFDKKEFRLLRTTDGRATFTGEGFDLELHEAAPDAPLSGTASVEVDLTYFHILQWLRKALLDGPEINYVNA